MPHTCRSWRPLAALALAALMGAAGGRSQGASSRREPQEPVQGALTLAPDTVKPGDTVTLTLTLTIADAWYVYRTAGSEGQRKLVLQLTLPPGLEAVGGWVWPTAQTVQEVRAVQIYTGTPAFTQRLRVGTATGEVPVTMSVSYQACNQEMCGPPTTLDLSTTLQVQP
jgi:DsbC/DsbD-like thiol-disulfide interchange protein